MGAIRTPEGVTVADKWVVTWERTAFVPIGRNPPSRERKTFDSQKEAVDFAMSLDDPQRRRVQLHLPRSDIAYLPTNVRGISKGQMKRGTEAPRCFGISPW